MHCIGIWNPRLMCILTDHKERTGCTGKRNRAAYVPLDEYSECHMASDFRLLEVTVVNLAMGVTNMLAGGHAHQRAALQ
jgi:hypothetical protein